MPAFFSGGTPRGGGVRKKFARIFFRPPPPRWLPGRPGCSAVWVICWVFGWLGHVVWCLHPVVFGAVCHCMLCNVMSGGTHEIGAIPRERGGGRLISSYCTLCEWPLRELLNENANMGVQNNYFVRKTPFSMGSNGGYGFKNSKKNKIQVPTRKNHPFSTHWVAMAVECPIRIVPFACVCSDPCECEFERNSRKFPASCA